MGKWRRTKARQHTKQGTDMTSHNVYFTTQYMWVKTITDASTVGEFVLVIVQTTLLCIHSLHYSVRMYASTMSTAMTRRHAR